MRNRFLYLLIVCLFLTAAGLGMGCTTIRGPAPTELMQDCPYPVVDMRTNKGLSDGLADYHASLKQCNLDKKGLRKWASD